MVLLVEQEPPKEERRFFLLFFCFFSSFSLRRLTTLLGVFLGKKNHGYIVSEEPLRTILQKKNRSVLYFLGTAPFLWTAPNGFSLSVSCGSSSSKEERTKEHHFFCSKNGSRGAVLLSAAAQKQHHGLLETNPCLFQEEQKNTFFWNTPSFETRNKKQKVVWVVWFLFGISKTKSSVSCMILVWCFCLFVSKEEEQQN